MENKPATMSMKLWLIRKVAQRENVPESTVEAVINHAFKGLVEAFADPEVMSVEVSGVGRFQWSYKKHVKELRKLREQWYVFTNNIKMYEAEGDERQKERAIKVRESVERRLSHLLHRVREYERRYPDKVVEKTIPFDWKCKPKLIEDE